MTESTISKNDVPLEASIPGVPLESILCTDELHKRPWRHPDYKKENRALVTLANALADSPRTILQTLAETILEVTQSDSAGLSLLTTDAKRFYWPAIAGMWKPHTGGGTPRSFGPCGDVLDRNVTLLFQHFERRYPYLLPVMPPAAECLLVPFYVGGKAVGTIWAIMHDDRRTFDAEDERLMTALGKVSSSAYQALVSIDALRFQIAEREKAETAVRELTNGLETQVRVRTVELEQRNQEVQKLRDQLYQENIALRESEAYLAEAQRLSRTGSFGWNVSSGELFWSEETYRVAGLDRAIKPMVEHVLQRVHPDDVVLVQQSFERAAREGPGLDFEHRFVMQDGSIKHVHVVAHAIKDEKGGLEYVGAVTDVTAAKIALQQIQELKDQLQRENLALREEVDAVSMFEEIVGASPALQAALSRVTKVAPTDSTVLITGETGTGKELIARAIHKRSQRAERAFVSVNCAAIPPSLIASELFGHEKGAFTGALQRHLGRFELAEGGTIFLDEIGELPIETQIALLHVLQEREFERVGGNQSLRADVRVIAATNRHLQAAIVAGTFRSDLFYRLNVFPIEIPPLRERKEDIRMLVEYFINRYASKAGKKIRSIDKDCLALLQSYPWPGNIRELQNVIERSIILCDTENFSVDESWLSLESVSTPPASQVFAEELVSHEKEIIEATLAETKGRVSGPSGAAAKLGIPASTLESKIKTLKINKFHFKPTDR